MIKLLISGFVLGVFLSGCSTKNIEPKYESKNYEDGKFQNQYINYGLDFDTFWDALKAYYTDETKNRVPDEEFNIPVVELDKNDIIDLENNSAIRFSHSTLLFKIDNRLVLTDPMFGERASPVSFYGPKRFHKNPIEIEELPYIDIVVISHNHYDHVDEFSLEKLKDKVGHFYVPLGVSKNLIEMGIDENKITELDWWQSIKDGSINLTATPSQHFSGRGLFDTAETLWASWVIKSSDTNLFFSGDSGYFKGFKEIGDRFGPFDMTFMETGAYNENWSEIHMMPEQSVQAHIDLKGKVMFPIHNGTFELALHSWTEPFERVTNEALKKGVKVVHPKMGQSISLKNYTITTNWWEKIQDKRFVRLNKSIDGEK